MKRYILVGLLSCATLAGCDECQIKFSPSQIVKQRLSGERGIVIRQSNIENYQGLCLTMVRLESGALENLAVEELEAAQ